MIIPKYLNKPILDLGCGFNDSGACIKLDYVTQISNVGKSVCNVLGDVHNLPFNDNSIGSIFAIQSFEHFYNPELVLKECYRVLKNGGKILVDVPLNLEIKDIDLVDLNNDILEDDDLLNYYKKNNWVSYRFGKPVVDIHTTVCDVDLVKNWFGCDLWKEISIEGGTFIYEKLEG